MVEMVNQSEPMNGGDGIHSYSRNSYYQEQFAVLEEDRINEVIAMKLDVKSLCSASNAFVITDLGCSSGPNTLIAMQNLIKAIKLKYQNQCPTSQMPEFQVFFNDQSSNDFNTLFSVLPQERQYFAAGVPGSFHRQLFPKSSIHLAYSSTALHWLSKVPAELLDKKSPAWNKGKIHYLTGPDEVTKAYSNQFAKDMDNFFNARAEEVVTGGMIVIIVLAMRHRIPHSHTSPSVLFNCLASCLMDMVKEGLIDEDKVDSFNVPMYYSSPEEMKTLAEKNGKFIIERMETSDPSFFVKDKVDITECAAHLRAGMEVMFTKQFGSEISNEIFERFPKKLTDHSDQLDATLRNGINLLLVLKRN